MATKQANGEKVTLEMVSQTETIIGQIRHPEATPRLVSMTLALANRSRTRVDAQAVADAIQDRWGLDALVWIVERAENGECFDDDCPEGAGGMKGVNAKHPTSNVEHRIDGTPVCGCGAPMEFRTRRKANSRRMEACLHCTRCVLQTAWTPVRPDGIHREELVERWLRWMRENTEAGRRMQAEA